MLDVSPEALKKEPTPTPEIPKDTSDSVSREQKIDVEHASREKREGVSEIEEKKELQFHEKAMAAIDEHTKPVQNELAEQKVDIQKAWKERNWQRIFTIAGFAAAGSAAALWVWDKIVGTKERPGFFRKVGRGIVGIGGAIGGFFALRHLGLGGGLNGGGSKPSETKEPDKKLPSRLPGLIVTPERVQVNVYVVDSTLVIDGQTYTEAQMREFLQTTKDKYKRSLSVVSHSTPTARMDAYDYLKKAAKGVADEYMGQ